MEDLKEEEGYVEKLYVKSHLFFVASLLILAVSVAFYEMRDYPEGAGSIDAPLTVKSIGKYNVVVPEHGMFLHLSNDTGEPRLHTCSTAPLAN